MSGLILGITLGTLAATYPGDTLTSAQSLATLVGGLWLDALKMTIIPLVMALLVVGIAGTAKSAQGSKLALHAVLLFIALLWIATIIAAFLIPGLLSLWPLSAETGALLKNALAAAPQPATATPDIASFLRSIIPTNPIAAAAQDQLLPLILFTSLFAVALTRLPEDRSTIIINFFTAVADAMLIIIGWILWLAPLGVLALAFNLGATVGTSAIGALGHYILIVSSAGLLIWALAYPLAIFAGGAKPAAFFRATAAPIAVALSTQSSLASLPAMLKASEDLGVAPKTASVTLPMAVAIFRVTSPAMNLAVVLYVAHWLGTPITPPFLIAGVVVAAITTMSSVSLPGQISFLTSITPIALTMGVPLEPLALLVAVEMIPDLIRTAGNVVMDVAATVTLSKHTKKEAVPPATKATPAPPQ